MKKLLILACTLAISSAAAAAPAKSAPPAHMTGVIEKYDAGTKTLTIKHDNKQTTFVVKDTAQIMNGKSKADVSALSASTGHNVKVEYVLDGGTRTADKIEVAAAAAKPATAAKKK